jgi:hypothetical protein
MLAAHRAPQFFGGVAVMKFPKPAHVPNLKSLSFRVYRIQSTIHADSFFFYVLCIAGYVCMQGHVSSMMQNGG